jgi:Family of unknown function (DUF6165)
VIMRAVTVSLSFGEAADKITILAIKNERMRDAAQLAHVRAELKLLNEAFFAAIARAPAFDALLAELRSINETLWRIEDDIRACETRGDFGAEFVTLARAVYRNNDERARLKREINTLLGSELVEEKFYARGNDSHG